MAIAAAAAAELSSSQESGNPINDQGSSYHYRTYITSITPKVPGLSVEVLEFADRLLLRNGTGKTVTVYGYSGEPYARVLPNGAAEQNKRSPAVYLNTNFYANVTVPAVGRAPRRRREWEAVDRTGQFEWHDHRIHWMSPVTPPAGQGHLQAHEDLRLDRADQGRQRSRGRSGESCSGCPRAPARRPARSSPVILIVLIGLATVVLVRRRRTRGGPRPPAGRGIAEAVRGQRREAVVSACRAPAAGHAAARSSQRWRAACCWLLTPRRRRSAHAQLLGTSPASGSTVPTQPAEVIFQFNENVGGTAGAVRVYNAQGERGGQPRRRPTPTATSTGWASG